MLTSHQDLRRFRHLRDDHLDFGLQNLVAFWVSWSSGNMGKLL